MSEVKSTENQIAGFQRAAQSLKLYRRAELQDEESGNSLIEDLYVDPLPKEHVFRTMMKPNTTFLIGRKGTGKSTIFQRVQHELRKSKSVTSAYIDIKTMYEQSQVDPDLFAKAKALPGALPDTSLDKLLLYRTFLKSLLSEIRAEIKKRLEDSLWERIKASFSLSLDELLEGLDDLVEQADNEHFMSILGVAPINITGKRKSEENTQHATKTALTVSSKPGIKVQVSDKDESKSSSSEEALYSTILMRVFDIKEFILRIKELLKKASIRNIYIFMDDFSELPHEAMTVVVDSLLTPLNNWSDEFIKFKVAAYPGRIYYGGIDKTKVDEIYLDIFKLYGTNDVSQMEVKAIDFTKRLLERRLQHFCQCDVQDFIRSDDEELWQLLFYASMGNPRTLGHILFNVHESHLIYNRRIGAKAIKDASRKYYEDKIEPYFAMNRFIHETFDERSSVLALKELLEVIVKQAKKFRSQRDSDVMRDVDGAPPTSHFHVLVSVESLLSTLELNFFLTKYYEMSDRDGRKVSVFALNYGLCQKYSVEFGRPFGKREYRLWYIERVFDYTPLLKRYMEDNQEIRCESCGKLYGLDQLDALRLYEMQCAKCKKGICRVTNLSKKYEEVLNSVAPELLLPRTELGILQTLGDENRPLFAAEIARELDCSYQLVGKRGKILADRSLVKRTKEDGRRKFAITKEAKETYVHPIHNENLDIHDDPSD